MIAFLWKVKKEYLYRCFSSSLEQPYGIKNVEFEILDQIVYHEIQEC
jgi:hypothetical protein